MFPQTQEQVRFDSDYGRQAAMVYGGIDPFAGRPKYRSRFSQLYARNILQAGMYYDELEAEVRQDAQRADSSLSMVFARALDYIIRKPYEAEYPELRAAEFLPLMTEVPPEALTFTYRMLDKLGQAAIIQENGSDAPKVDIKGNEWQSPIITIGASYDYTIMDTLRAARMGVPLEAYKAEAARFACDYLVEVIAAVGAANNGVPGFTNAPGINATAQVSAGGTANWIQQIGTIPQASETNATPPAVVVAQAIAGDINAMISKVFTATQGIHRIDTVLVDVAAYTALMTAPRSPGFTDDTLLDYLEKLCMVDVECWPQLGTAGATTTNYAGTAYKGRVMGYKKDPKLLNLVIAQPFTQLPPQPVKMAWEVTCYERTGGVTVRYPLTATYMDGVS